MRVEVMRYSVTKAKGKSLLESTPISSGNWKGIKDFLGKGTKIAAFCSLDNETGSVLVIDLKKKIRVFKYKSPDDPDCMVMDINLPIGIKKEQELSIVSLRKKPVREVLVHLKSDSDQSQENNPQDIFEEDPSNSPPFAA